MPGKQNEEGLRHLHSSAFIRIRFGINLIILFKLFDMGIARLLISERCLAEYKSIGLAIKVNNKIKNTIDDFFDME